MGRVIIKDKKFFVPGRESQKIHKIFSDDIGKQTENRALRIAEKELRSCFKRIKYTVNFCCEGENGDKLRGRDLEFIILSPFILRHILKNTKIYLEIKTSKAGARKHRQRAEENPLYKTEVIIVRKRQENKVARSMYNAIKKEIRRLLREKKEKSTFLKIFLTEKIIVRLSQ
ncbi:MAG: hypothetical protein ABIH51_00210 [Patescibacteria group bacterium]